MENNSNQIKKKTWAKPEIYLLDTRDVNGGAATNFKEGAPVGAGMYKLHTPGGVPLTNVPKGIWDNYHS